MSQPASDSEIRRIATMWIEIIRLQISRLEDCTDTFQGAMADQQFREAFDELGMPAEWAKEASEARSVLTDRDLAALAADKYFLLLATAQLIKCVDLLPNDALPQPPSPKIGNDNLITLLRNLEEHWDDLGGRSATALRQQISDIEPGRLHFNKHDTWIEGISVAGLLSWAEDVDRKIRGSVADTDT